MKYRFLPIFLVAMLLAVMALFSLAVDNTAHAGAGDPIPLGDQLGDVGQYYSNVSPNMHSHTYIYNTAGASRTVKVEIRSDTNTLHHTVTCNVAANRVLYLQMTHDPAGSLVVEGGTSTGVSGEVCGNGGKTYRGIYHMKIWQTQSGDDLAVSVVSAVNAGVMPDPKGVAGAYQAAPSWGVSSEYVLPAVTLYRSLGWDTEIVVQNVSGETIKVNFEWSLDNESGLRDNNVATLAANERRSFLASQLLYAPAGGGSLAAKEGWTWMKVRGFHPTNGTPKNIAVTTNMFKQGLVDGKFRAEYGSEQFMQFEAPLAGTELFVPGFKVDGTNSYFRVANASAYVANLTMRLYDIWGTQVGSTYTNSVDNQKAKHFASNVFGASNGTYTLRISSTQNVTAAAWYASGGGHTGVTAQRVGDSDGVWAYLPLYWSNYHGWDDKWTFALVGTAGKLDENLYKRTDGSHWNGMSLTDGPLYGLTNRNYGSAGNIELYGTLDAIANGTKPLAIGTFEIYSTTNDHIVSYNGIAKKSGTWYVPFAPAPVVQYVEATNPFNAGGYGEGSAPLGFAWNGSQGGNYPANLTGWVYTTWDMTANTCSSNSRYIPRTGHKTSPYTAAQIALRNVVPSACAGRPLLMYNEPVVETGSWGTTNPSPTHPYSANNMASAVFRHRTFPGSLEGFSYSIASFSQTLGTYATSIAYDGSKINRPSFGNIEHWYGQITGSTILPLDRIALHLYVGADHVCNVSNSDNCVNVQNEIHGAYKSGGGPYDIKKRLTDWRDYIYPRYGSMEYRFDEWGIAANETAETKDIAGNVIPLEGQSPKIREMVRSGMVDLAKVTSEVFSGIYTSTAPMTATVKSLHWFIGYQQNCHVSTAYYAGVGTQEGDGICLAFDGNDAQGGGSVFFLAQDLSSSATTVVLTSKESTLSKWGDDNGWGDDNVAIFATDAYTDRIINESVEKVKIDFTKQNAVITTGPVGDIYTHTVKIIRAVGGTTARAWSASDTEERQLRTQLYHHDATSLIGTWVDERRSMPDDWYDNKSWNDVGACYNTLRTGWTSTSSVAPTTGICFDNNWYGTSANSGHWP